MVVSIVFSPGEFTPAVAGDGARAPWALANFSSPEVSHGAHEVYSRRSLLALDFGIKDASNGSFASLIGTTEIPG
jgi:hypothetical protein